jgi:hypothetical protein
MMSFEICGQYNQSELSFPLALRFDVEVGWRLQPRIMTYCGEAQMRRKVDGHIW